MAIKSYVMVCGGTGCESSKADEIYRNLHKEAELQGVSEDVQIVKTGCFGFCEQGPIVKVLPSDHFYVQVVPEDAKEIIAEDILKGRAVSRLLYKEGNLTEVKRTDGEDIKFYQKQLRIVLRNCGLINPENVNEYIARDGYQALEKALFDMSGDDIIEELKKSGLRGRGGAGFPTWMKWNFSKQVETDVKYVACNADEGDPGAYMDRSVLEGDPHSVIEAMTIAGKCVGANLGIIYIRAEYPLAINRLETAMEQARDLGLLARISWVPAMTLTLSSDSVRAPSSAVRKPLFSSPSRVTGVCLLPSLPSPLWKVSGPNPPLSITWKPTPISLLSSTRAATGSPSSVRKNPREPRYSP